MHLYKNSSSDLAQESYVLSVLEEKRNGYYVELGSGDPAIGNNTRLLEEEFEWVGLALDVDEKLVQKYNLERRNKCIKADALTFDYIKYFEENNFPKEIDYLQIDIDDHENSACMLALLALPMLKYRFRVITIEHDLIRNFKWQAMRDAQREILSSLGYTLTGQLVNEDWWVDKNLIPNYSVESFIGNPHIDDEK